MSGFDHGANEISALLGCAQRRLVVKLLKFGDKSDLPLKMGPTGT